MLWDISQNLAWQIARFAHTDASHQLISRVIALLLCRRWWNKCRDLHWGHLHTTCIAVCIVRDWPLFCCTPAYHWKWAIRGWGQVLKWRMTKWNWYRHPGKLGYTRTCWSTDSIASSGHSCTSRLEYWFVPALPMAATCIYCSVDPGYCLSSYLCPGAHTCHTFSEFCPLTVWIDYWRSSVTYLMCSWCRWWMVPAPPAGCAA